MKILMWDEVVKFINGKPSLFIRYREPTPEKNVIVFNKNKNTYYLFNSYNGQFISPIHDDELFQLLNKAEK